MVKERKGCSFFLMSRMETSEPGLMDLKVLMRWSMVISRAMVSWWLLLMVYSSNTLAAVTSDHTCEPVRLSLAMLNCTDSGSSRQTHRFPSFSIDWQIPC